MAFILSQLLKKKTPDWNSVVWTEDKFLQTSAEMKVRVIESESIKAKGEYVIYKNVSFIVLRPKLPLQLRLWVGLHELGHHLLHFPVNHKFSKSVTRKFDREANFFAAIALLPTFVVENKTLGEIIDEYNYPKILTTIRKEIYDAYKM
jgi:Zn-dependent peptidase ImmA (M78 family)